MPCTPRDKTLFGFLMMPFIAIALSGCAGTDVVEDSDADAPYLAYKKPEPINFSEIERPPGEAESSDKGDWSTKSATAGYHFSMARAYSLSGEHQRAVESYRAALNYDPESALLRAKLSSELVKLGLLSDALQEAKNAVELDPNYIDARLLLAGLYSTASDNESAIREYDTILKLDPESEEAAVFRAQVLIESGKTGGAITSLENFVKKQPGSTVGWFYLGQAYQRRGDNGAAEKSFKKAIEIEDRFSQAYLSLGYLYEADSKDEKAIKVYESLYNRSQNISAAKRISTLLLKAERYKEALPFLEVVMANDPDDLNTQVKLGLIYIESGRLDDSDRLFSDLQRKNPDSDRVHYYLASVQEEKKEFENALENFLKVKPESEFFNDSSIHAAYIYQSRSENDKAKSLIRDSIKKSPKYANFYVYLAALEEQDKNFQTAIDVLKSGETLFPDHEKILYYQGSLFDKIGDTDSAVHLMEKILSSNPDHSDALNYIGYTWTSKGVRLREAGAYLQRAIALQPDNAFILDSWGWHLFTLGKYSRAAVVLEKAAELQPAESIILEHLADVYVQLNLKEKAVAQYEEALRLAKEISNKSTIETKLANLKTDIAKRDSEPLYNDRVPAENGSKKNSN